MSNDQCPACLNVTIPELPLVEDCFEDTIIERPYSSYQTQVLLWRAVNELFGRNGRPTFEKGGIWVGTEPRYGDSPECCSRLQVVRNDLPNPEQYDCFTRWYQRYVIVFGRPGVDLTAPAGDPSGCEPGTVNAASAALAADETIIREGLPALWRATARTLDGACGAGDLEIDGFQRKRKACCERLAFYVQVT